MFSSLSLNYIPNSIEFQEEKAGPHWLPKPVWSLRSYGVSGSTIPATKKLEILIV